MRLKPSAKLSKNLKLLHSCSQVRVIDLTEKIDQLDKQQIELINNSSKLKTFLEGVYQENHEKDDTYIINPSTTQLTNTDLSKYKDFEPDEEFAEDFKTYAYLYNRKNKLNFILDEFEELNELLGKRNVPVTKVNTFLNKYNHSKAFKSFSDYMKSHSAIRISLQYKQKANEIAERNGIADATYYSKSNKAFSLKSVSLKLDKEFKGRLRGGIVKTAAAVALSASLFSAGFGFGKNSTNITQGDTIPHATEETITPSTEPIGAPEEKEDLNIFTNSISTPASYEDACDAYFEAIEDVYKYNTGKEIDLSGYDQKHIGINGSAPILEVEHNGKIYRFSGQSQINSNYRHLKEAFDALGANYTETNSSILYIVDKNNPNQSISIVDSAGNPVRSGNVITENNRAYNSEYVREGRKILEAQGKNTTSLSEAECVAAFLLSDSYDIQNPDLSIAQGNFPNSTSSIKNYFYYKKDGKPDSFAIYVFTNDLNDEKTAFEHSISNENIQQQTTDDKEHDDR